MTFSKKIALTFLICCFQLSLIVKAQDNVGIGTNTPDASAKLELLSTNKGFLVPRMNTVGMNAILNPANSLLIYNTDSMCYYFYRQPTTSWISMCSLNTGNNFTDSTYVNYAYIDSLFANYNNVDSLFANYINIDSIFANYMNIDSLFATYISTDSIYTNQINVDSLFANYINIDSLFANYINIDSLFASYINIDSLFASYVNIDSLFSNFIHTDSIVSNYINVDSLFANYINIDSLFSNYINTDSLFATYISTDSIIAHYINLDSLLADYINSNFIISNHINVDSLFANYSNIDSLFANYINTNTIIANYGAFDSLTVDGVPIQSFVNNLITVSDTDSICNSATTNYVAKFTSPTSICNSIIYDNGTNIGIGTTTPNTTFDLVGSAAFRETSLTLINGNNNDLVIGNNTFINLTGPSAAFTITGLAGGSSGRIITLYNSTNQSMTIAEQNGSSVAANRISTLTGSDVITVAGNGSSVQLQYSAAASRWILINGGWYSSTPSNITPSYNGVNRFSNGDFSVDQRNSGNSQTFTAGNPIAYSVDRWYGSCTGANITGQRVAGTLANKYAYRFTGSASNTGTLFGQRIEAVNIAALVNSNIVVSLQAKSSSITSVTWSAYYANVSDVFSAKTLIATGSFAITSSLANYNFTFNAGPNVGNGICIEFTTGALVATQTLQYEAIQLESGTTPSAFQQKAIAFNLLDCQRYYETGRSSYDEAYMNGTWVTYNQTFFRTTKRVVPSITVNAGTLFGEQYVDSFNSYVVIGSAPLHVPFVWWADAEL